MFVLDNLQIHRVSQQYRGPVGECRPWSYISKSSSCTGTPSAPHQNDGSRKLPEAAAGVAIALHVEFADYLEQTDYQKY